MKTIVCSCCFKSLKELLKEREQSNKEEKASNEERAEKQKEPEGGAEKEEKKEAESNLETETKKLNDQKPKEETPKSTEMGGVGEKKEEEKEEFGDEEEQAKTKVNRRKKENKNVLQQNQQQTKNRKKKKQPNRLPFLCPNCREVYFCSKECEEIGMTLHTFFECFCLKKLHNKAFDFDYLQLSSMRLVISALGLKIKEQKQQTTSLSPTPILSSTTSSSPPSPSSFSLPEPISPKFEDFVELIGSIAAVDKEKYPEEYSGYKKMESFLWKLIHSTKLFKNDLIITSELIGDLLVKDDKNGFGLWSETSQLFGTAIFPSASFINHSCFPNCSRYPEIRTLSFTSPTGSKVIHHRFHTITLRTIRPIKKGEELSIAYVSPAQTVEERNELLSGHYHFNCCCVRCSPTSRDESERFEMLIKKFVCEECGHGLFVPITNSMRKCRQCGNEVRYSLTDLEVN
eukprot:TRINITY_DN4635_c0_g1_i1.p1 TRINITY_DN4635_c0_g1~~TRINITY_DN4635_c0_g1_i1.p1  ORF type:complete len:533 (-),score=143.97 TRINITY_DN4635_c0_g1_i1:190-1563(-)